MLTILVSVVVGAVIAVAGGAGGATWAGIPVVVVGAAVAFFVNWLVFIPAYMARTERFYDLTGTVTYLSLVTIALLGGPREPLAWVLAVLVAIWALRLGLFLVRRIAKDGSDGRFDDIKQDAPRFLMSWTLQALWVVITLSCAMAAMTSLEETGLGALTWIGLAIWALGFGIEVVADAQKRRFRADPANDGRFITTGVWAWSRHPNYFGEITLWIGIAVISLPALRGWQFVTLISPVFVALLLTRISGIPMLEARGRKRWGDEQSYRRYVERTPVLVPRPPRPS